MVNFNYSSREVTVKIVYYGPGLCGKTTSLQHIYDTIPQPKKGKMVSLATQTDRTLFFDFLPIELGKIKGLNTKIQLYTVPGQVFYDSTRKLVLKGADGVVFVADSQTDMMQANIESFENLMLNLQGLGLDLAKLPHVIQYNKRDLKNIAPIDELDKAINKFKAPYFATSAVTGEGVHEALRTVIKLVLSDIANKYNLELDEMLVEEKKQSQQSEDFETKPPVSEVSEDDLSPDDSVSLSEIPFPEEFSEDLEEIEELEELEEIKEETKKEEEPVPASLESVEVPENKERELDLPNIEVFPGTVQHVDGNHYHIPMTIVINEDIDLNSLKLTVDLNFKKMMKRD
jgi:signal recognition particle receptor subunit beta